MVVDCHVHGRDFTEAYKGETVKHCLEVARDSGVNGIFFMPNTKPPIMTEKELRDYITLGEQANVPEVFFGIYMGLTKNKDQIKMAIDLHKKYFPRVVGMKLYAGHSVNELGVIHLADQFTVYEKLAQEGYTGVLAVHAEKESELKPTRWNYKIPATHCLARPAEAEVASVHDQIDLATKTGFKGKMHIAHISSPQAVNLVMEAKNQGLDISSGVCPHHLIYDWTQMFKQDGILWKMNPPLRQPGDPELMLEHLRKGEVDWIETDHAVHHVQNEKLAHPYMSGIPGLAQWDLFKEFLRSKNFSEKRIYEVTHKNVIERFGIEVPLLKKVIKDRRKDYAFNAYTELEQILNYK